MAWFRCYDNSDVIATLIMTNFHLLWWRFFQMFVYGDVVDAQTWYWPWKTVSSHLHTPVRPMLLQYGPRFFGQIVYRPPWQKISRTLMLVHDAIAVNTDTRQSVSRCSLQTQPDLSTVSWREKKSCWETDHNVICCPLDVVSNFFSFSPKLH